MLAATAAGLGTIRGVVHTAGVSPVHATSEQIVAVDVVGTAHVLDAFEIRTCSRGPSWCALRAWAGTMTTSSRPTCL